jgi:hypothetical protein
MKKDTTRNAIISADGEYRYQLSRIWDEEKPNILFIMLNPSTADADVDDGNLYAFRSTDPKALRNTDDPVGEDNIEHIKELIGVTERVVYAWGNNQKEPEWLSSLVDTPYCIDISKKGLPKHPLYLKSELHPKLYLRDV